MKHRRSIVTEVWAREILAIVPKDHKPARLTLGNPNWRALDFTVRRCSKSWRHDYALTGGLVVEAPYRKEYKHASPAGMRWYRRLPAGWTDERLRGCVRGIYLDFQRRVREFDGREKLYELANKKTKGWHPGRLEALTKAAGNHDKSYSDMDRDDLDYWFTILNAIEEQK